VSIHVFCLSGYVFRLHSIKQRKLLHFCSRHLRISVFSTFIPEMLFFGGGGGGGGRLNCDCNDCEPKCARGGAVDASVTREIKLNTTATLFLT
jgi:hypothetical protein